MHYYTPNIIGAGELHRKAATVLRQVAASDRESFVVTHNEPRVVIMSIPRYETLRALEDEALFPHPKTSPQRVRAAFAKTRKYSKDFLNDLEGGLKKSSLYA